MKWLCETVHRKRYVLWPNDQILHHDNGPADKALFVKQFLAQNLITEMSHPLYSPDLAVSKNKTCVKGTKTSGY
jgi:hypothetical protein